MKKSSASKDHVAQSASERASSPRVAADTPADSDEAQKRSSATVCESLAESLRVLALDVNLALLVVDGVQPPQLLIENDNSVCAQMQSAPVSATRCVPYCGEAHARAIEAGGATSYKCHAGLECCATSIKSENSEVDDARELVSITGRAFVRTEDFRQFVARIEHGDYSDLDADALFQNVIFTTREKILSFAERVRRIANAPAFEQTLREQTGGEDSHTAEALRRSVTAADLTATNAIDSNVKKFGDEKEFVSDREGGDESIEERSGKSPTVNETSAYSSTVIGLPDNIHFPRDSSLRDACAHVLRLLAAHAGLKSAAIALRSNDNFKTFASGGRLASVKALDLETLLKDGATSDAVRRSLWLTLPSHDAVSSRRRVKESGAEKSTASLTLLALNIGDELKGVLALDTETLNEVGRGELTRFARAVAMPLEVLRLREELEQRMRAAYHLQNISGSINAAKPEETYETILKQSVELLHAERGSLLLFDEASRELSVKVSLGPRSEVTQDERMNIGEGVSGNVMSSGRPLVVSDVRSAASACAPASAERKYKSDSFISYPIMDKARPVAVLNVTDKKGGGVYDEADLHLIEMIAPQISIALDRAAWHQKATLFQMLSITDPLTGLLNRRYLEERMNEEIGRSKRHHYQMSFMMIDIDDFKLYNDLNGHQAGDVALEMTAQTLKSALRAADVAARYGGEELCVLLPQTNLDEAHIIGERIRRRVERTQYHFGTKQPHGALTVSIGISVCSDKLDTPKMVIEAADRALYLAKHDGKNCVRTLLTIPEKGQDEPPTNDVSNAHGER